MCARTLGWMLDEVREVCSMFTDRARNMFRSVVTLYQNAIIILNNRRVKPLSIN